ncbi:MAG TPA: LON peptidase substrate-binding domain-containing protein [Candidatus Thermoplasmatota archaeon]|nr:LON peptidase substrate-binding domain-containing protein [Candidatus Thermoplasmatota archaeon]
MDRIPIFPLDVVVFPGEVFGLDVFEERYLLMTEEVLAEGLPIGIVLARQDEPEDVIEHQPESVGTAVEIISHERVGDRFLLQTVGRRRFVIRRLHATKPYQEADVEWLDEDTGDPQEARELAAEVIQRIVSLGGQVDDESAIDDPVTVSHAVAAALPLDLQTKQALLEADDARMRLAVEAELLADAAG